MLIYEKDNKLNINFENSVDGEPDLQIGKDGDKTEVLIDGQSGGGSNAPLICTDTEGTLDKAMGEIQAAFLSGRIVYVNVHGPVNVVISLDPVHYSPFANAYIGGICDSELFEGAYKQYLVTAATEEEALAAYPTCSS